jgi:hypothetical protein
MMACKDIRERLSAYIEGVVTPEEKTSIGEHLTSCRPCSSALTDLRKTGKLLEGLEEVEPPPWLKQKIMAQIREEAEQKKGILERLFYPLRVKVPVQVFATLAIVVIVLYVYKTIEPEMKVVPLPSGTVTVTPKAETPREPEKALKEVPAPVGKTVAQKDVREESRPAPLKPAEQERPAQDQIIAQKQEVVADKREEAPKALKASVPQVSRGLAEMEKPSPPAVSAPASPAPPTPAHPVRPAPVPATVGSPASTPATKEKESIIAGGTGAKDREEKKGLGALQAKSVVSEKPAPYPITLVVKDVAGAAVEVEKLLAQLGASEIKHESGEATENVTASLPASRLDESLEKLKNIGKVREKAARPAIPTSPDSRVQILIEIIILESENPEH